MAFAGDGRALCWERPREGGTTRQPSHLFFDRLLSDDAGCRHNWFGEASGEAPSFSAAAAPALVGFLDSVDRTCRDSAPASAKALPRGQRCARANLNVLSLETAEGATPFNSCRALEWQARRSIECSHYSYAALAQRGTLS